MNKQNNCTKYREEIAVLVLGLLEPEEVKTLQKHLETCQDCKSLYEDMLNEEDSLRSGFKEISQKGKVIQNSLIEKLENNELETVSEPKVVKINWGKIIKSPLIKLAAAAVIIFAIGFLFNNGSITITSPAFSIEDVVSAVNNHQWIHSKIVNLSSDAEAIQIYKENDLAGAWTLINPFRQINIHTNQIIYSEYSLGKEIVYYPKSNLITISHLGIQQTKQYEYLSDFTKENILAYEKDGAKVKYKNGRIDGKPVKIINIDTTGMANRIESKSTWYIDAKTNLPIMIKNNKSKTYRVFNFPEKAPKDIYEAGAPRDAKVIIIHSKDNPSIFDTPDVPELKQALRWYNSARENLISDYILISTYEYDSSIKMLDIVNHQGKNQNENYRSTCYTAKELSNFLNDKTTNFETLREWSEIQDINYQNIAIHYNGRNYFSAWQGIYDPWITEGKRNWPLSINKLLDWGWPKILPKANVHKIENDYSLENGLVAFEIITEPEIINNKLLNAAQKNIFYIDPSRDYMCVRKEEYQHFVMGGTPINDIHFDVNEISNEISCVQYVTEFGQTETGQWYPKKIETHSKTWDSNGTPKPLSLSFIVTLYLKSNSEFPERFFNPENPPLPE